MAQSEITNPHAMFFEKVFSRTDVISDIIQYYLPRSIVKILDLLTIRIEPGSFITNDLKPTQSDLLFKVQTRDHLPILLYFLFEHKSDMDRWIMLQLLGYIVQICHKQRSENKQKRQEKRNENKLANRPENEGIKTEYLYPIIPVVFYHGKTRWKVTDFSALFQGKIDTQYFPDFTYELINLADYQDEYFKGNVIARVALMAMKHYFLDDYNEKVPQILDLLASLLENYESEIAFIEALMRYLSTRKSCDKEWLKTNLKQSFKEKGEQVMSSIADEWIEEGKKEGKKEGKIEGALEEARISVIDVLKLKYANISNSITSMLQNIQDHNALRTLHREAVLAKNISEFQTRLSAYQRI